MEGRTQFKDDEGEAEEHGRCFASTRTMKMDCVGAICHCFLPKYDAECTYILSIVSYPYTSKKSERAG